MLTFVFFSNLFDSSPIPTNDRTAQSEFTDIQAQLSHLSYILEHIKIQPMPSTNSISSKSTVNVLSLFFIISTFPFIVVVV